ncbi:MAG: helix-turn-helix domain-containing protein [Deltaproteobacteria bacterium]|nr:helix-turn-helix domain-containing protein [Deltaproteobacteria bacterium]
MEWVKWQLAIRGVTISALALELGIGQSSVSHGLRQGSRRVEAAVAAQLGVPASDIWPERYDEHGARIDRRFKPKLSAEEGAA